MNAITSIYIPHVENHFNAEYVADVFDRNGIAQVSRIFIEPYDASMKTRYNIYNHVYVQINNWHQTEAAYRFIQRLHNPTTETRIVHSDDNWWLVKINANPAKLSSNVHGLTIFSEQPKSLDDSLSTLAVQNNHEILDYEEDYDEDYDEDYEEDYSDYVAYLKKIDDERNLSYYIKVEDPINAMQQEDYSNCDDYLTEIDFQRRRWYSDFRFQDEISV